MEKNKEFADLRARLGLTQVEVAALLDRSPAWVRGIEKKSEPHPCPQYAIYALRYLIEHPEDVNK